MKSLIVYYSLTGNTELIANTIAEAIEGDQKAVLRLKPLKELPANKFTTFMWGGLQAKCENKPELEPYQIKVEEYDLIFLGTPVWAWTLSPPLRTFVEKEMSGLKKAKIALFSSSGSDGKKAMHRFESYMKSYQILGSKCFIEPKSQRTEEQKQIAITWMKEILQKA